MIGRSIFRSSRIIHLDLPFEAINDVGHIVDNGPVRPPVPASAFVAIAISFCNCGYSTSIEIYLRLATIFALN